MQQQLTLEQWFTVPPRLEACPHDNCFTTHAYVPAGVSCMSCEALLLQYIPQSPDELGYLSADWAWKYVDGNEWTTEWPK